MKVEVTFLCSFALGNLFCECRYEIPYDQVRGKTNELFGDGNFEFNEVSNL